MWVQKISQNLRHQSMEYGVSDCFLPISFFFLAFCPTSDWPDNRETSIRRPPRPSNHGHGYASNMPESVTKYRIQIHCDGPPLPRTVPREEKRVWLPRINHANDSVKKNPLDTPLAREGNRGEKKRNHWCGERGTVYETGIV